MIYFDELHNAYGDLRSIEGKNIVFKCEDNIWIEAQKGKYIWQEDKLVENHNYEIEQAQKERERLNMLSLTAADVERAIYKAKGMDFEDILTLVSANPPEGLDIKALKIELKANNFYRGNPYIDVVGGLLGFGAEQLDKFFETGDYTALLPPKVEEAENSDTDSDSDTDTDLHITETEAE